MFSAAFLVQALLASAVLAIPTSKELRASRRQRRAGAPRQGKPTNLVQEQVITGGNTSHVSYSSNWAGAVLVADTATYTSVTGTFIVPNLEPNDGSLTECASAWVGIDGDTCDTAILQTGLDFCVEGSSVLYQGWYEYYPDFSDDFYDITFSPGDSVTITATTSSQTSGALIIENKTTGVSVSTTLASSASLCQFNAEWIVEDFEECYIDCFLVPFANFGTIAFTDASAGTVSGSSVTALGATIWDIYQNNTILTSVVSNDTENTVTITYV